MAAAMRPDRGSVEHALSMLADRLDQRADEIANAVIGSGGHEVTPSLLTDLRRLCGELLQATYSCVAHAGSDDAAAPDFDAIAAGCVAVGLSVEVVVRIVRSAHQEIAATVVGEQLRGSRGAADLDDMSHVSAITFGYVETTIAHLVEAHAVATELRRAVGDEARAAAVAALLGDDHPDISRYERDLDYPVAGHHVAFVLWSTDGTHPMAELARLARECGAAIGGDALLTVNHGASMLFCWAQAESGVPGGIDDLLRRRLERSRVGVAIGLGHDGIDGFRQSHIEAQRAYRVQKLGRRPGGVIDYGDAALLSMLSADFRAAQVFVDARLGGLAADDARTRTVADTLEAYFEEGCNQTRTAARLGVHVKSVSYRIRRAEEFLGHTADRRMFETWAALTLLRLKRDGEHESRARAVHRPRTGKAARPGRGRPEPRARGERAGVAVLAPA